MKLLIGSHIDETEPPERKQNLCVLSSPERTSVVVGHMIAAPFFLNRSVVGADSPGFTSSESRAGVNGAAARLQAALTV